MRRFSKSYKDFHRLEKKFYSQSPKKRPSLEGLGFYFKKKKDQGKKVDFSQKLSLLRQKIQSRIKDFQQAREKIRKEKETTFIFPKKEEKKLDFFRDKVPIAAHKQDFSKISVRRQEETEKGSQQLDYLKKMALAEEERLEGHSFFTKISPFKKIQDKLRSRKEEMKNKKISSIPTGVAKVNIFKNFFKKGKRAWAKRALIVLVIIFCFGLVSLIGIFAYFAKDLPSPGKIYARNLAESTKIYDRKGETILYEVHGEVKRTLVSLDQVAEAVKQATIVCEDKDFYKHSGFSLRGITRALFVDIFYGKNQLQGGSTITQQFVKNSILTPERTLTRKIKELILSIEMEWKFSKDEILEMYLNEIPYGSNAYGIEAASQTFFEKSAKDLTIAEAAVLASLPKAPTYYSPYGAHTDELEARKNWVIDGLISEGYITKEEGEAAKTEELKFAEQKEGIIAPHFVIYVKEQLVEKYGERMVEEGGLKVYTTLDVSLQRLAERVVAEGVARNTERYRATNAALVAIDPRTGEILAMQGSKDYFDREAGGNVNVAIRDRQPGSSFKPFAYAAAFNKGYVPETILFDLETDFGNYKPRNYDLAQRGPISMRNALAGSINIPAVKTLYLAGVETTIDLAHQMGITTLNEPDRYGLSLVLGGGEVKLLDMVSAFGVFAQDGVRHEKKAILKIEDRDGNILEEAKSESRQVLDKQVARLITDVLSDDAARSFIFGSGSALTLSGRPVAAKTGTTENYRDGWTIGYTPSLVAGVWAGNNDNSEMVRGAGGIYVAAPIWHDFMEEALAGKPVENFEKPEKTNSRKPILAGMLEEEKKVKLCKPSMLLATDRCPKHLIEEKTYREVHTILYYVDKDNPNGPYPSNPQNDPQFNRWEGPVQAWAEKKGYLQEKPPQDYDTLHDVENQPEVSILTPESGETITSDGDILISSQAQAKRGIAKVEFYLDNILIGEDTVTPYQLKYNFINTTNGDHLISVRAFDDVDNMGESNVTVKVQITRPPTVSLLQPQESLVTLSKRDFPYTLSAQAYAESGAKSITFYSKDLSTGEITTIGSVTGKSKEIQASVAWSYPGKGEYRIFAEVIDQKGKVATSEKIKVIVK